MVLASQISHLLLRLGILSRVRRAPQGKYRDLFNVEISGKVEQLKFIEEVGIFGERSKLIPLAKKELSEIIANPNLDVIPKEIWEVIEVARRRQNLTTRDFHRELGWAYSGTQRHQNGISRNRLTHVLTVLEDGGLGDLCESSIYWDRVVSLEKIGRAEVYDATVPGYHNFVANDIIVHNSIEQDSDLVMFLYRPDDEDRTGVNLLISKHRNGPTGEIPLYFRGERTKFYEQEGVHA